MKKTYTAYFAKVIGAQNLTKLNLAAAIEKAAATIRRTPRRVDVAQLLDDHVAARSPQRG